MNLKPFRFGRKKHVGKLQKQPNDINARTEHLIDTYFIKRFSNLRTIRRSVIGWLALLVLLIGAMVGQNIYLSNSFQTIKPAPGGVYKEGVLGTFTNANPIFATNNVDTTIARLVFAGLLKHDENNKLVGELAESYTTDTNGLKYTVKLRENLTWHDGKPLTAEDVVFTFKTIQNPDTQSPLQSSWQGVDISAPNPQTVVFELPSPLATFPENLTTGVIPKHLLAKIPPADLRSAEFNTTRPIGAGPFAWQAIDVDDATLATSQQQIALTPFDNYVLGEPKLGEFIVFAYNDKDQLIDGFLKNKLTALEGINDVPASLNKDSSMRIHNIRMNAANMVFFKVSNGVLADKDVRQSLVQSADVKKIISKLPYSARKVNEPILQGQVGYDPAYAQTGFNLDAAKQKLEAAGWKLQNDGFRSKNNQKLSFKLSAPDTTEAKMVTNQLKQQWRQLGVDLRIDLQKPSDFQSTISYHGYDAVLYGITIGSDPDVFVYWASSQADIRSGSRLNLSEYKDTSADVSLEAGRTRHDPAIRAVKYRPFLQAWQQDAPALGLYQPRLLYITSGPVFGLGDYSIDSAVGRLNNVHNWQIRQAKTTNN